MMIDTHAHLEMDAFDADRDEVLERARAAGVEFILTIGNAHPESGSHEKALALCHRHPDLATTAGIHPHEARIASEQWYGRIADLAADPKVWAIGEIGLDYYYDHSPRDTQRAVFRDLLWLARRLERPVVIHSRDADAELLELLEQHWAAPNPGGILHCFSGGPELARRGLALGLYVSFAGPLTFKKADDLRAAAAGVPPDRLLAETDCPYLAPMPHRGRRNEPAYVAEVVAALARVHGRDPGEMARITSANFKNLFRRRFGG